MIKNINNEFKSFYNYRYVYSSYGYQLRLFGVGLAISDGFRGCGSCYLCGTLVLSSVNMMEASSNCTESPLLKLPLKIRFKIYRYLYLNTKPIGIPSSRQYHEEHFGWDVSRALKLPVAALRVCQQLYHEGSTILYGENKFAFKINENGEKLVSFLKGKHNDGIKERRGFPVEKMKRYVIIVEIQREEEFRTVQASVIRVCRSLSYSPEI